MNGSKRIGASHSKLVIERTNGTPLIMDVSGIKSKVDVLNYLEERDDYREKDGKGRVCFFFFFLNHRS